MGRTYGTHGGYGKCIHNFCRKLKGRGHLEDVGVDRSIILNTVFVDWIQLAQDRIQ
jgi:hypothetical protein